MWFRGGVCQGGGRQGTVAPVGSLFSVHAQVQGGLLPTKSWTGIVNGGGLFFHAGGDSRWCGARPGVRVLSLCEDTDARHTLRSLQQAQ